MEISVFLLQVIMTVVFERDIGALWSLDPGGGACLFDVTHGQPLFAVEFCAFTSQLSPISWPIIVGSEPRLARGIRSPKHAGASRAPLFQTVVLHYGWWCCCCLVLRIMSSRGVSLCCAGLATEAAQASGSTSCLVLRTETGVSNIWCASAFNSTHQYILLEAMESSIPKNVNYWFTKKFNIIDWKGKGVASLLGALDYAVCSSMTPEKHSY